MRALWDELRAKATPLEAAASRGHPGWLKRPMRVVRAMPSSMASVVLPRSPVANGWAVWLCRRLSFGRLQQILGDRHQRMTDDFFGVVGEDERELPAQLLRHVL